ncbi:cytochrome C biogenesis protein [beta proteobacterium AAP99]|nr:cytochrome C biogenesis protein [beta proteobacterium AAP99]
MPVSVTHAGLSLAAGSLTTLSPCVFPLLPLVLGGALQGHRLSPVALGLGMATSFSVIGVALGALGPALGIDSDSVRVFGAWLLIVFALVMLVPAWSEKFTQLMAPLASSANTAATRFSGSSLPSAFGLGAVLGLVWSPCSGPLLASALTLVASEGGALRGGLILGLFGLGAAIPLVAVAYASRAGFMKARGWVMGHIHLINHVFAGLLGFMGVAILMGWDKWLEARILALLPESWVNLTVMF